MQKAEPVICHIQLPAVHTSCSLERLQAHIATSADLFLDQLVLPHDLAVSLFAMPNAESI